MAAIGARAEWLLENHALNYGLGIGSPLEKLYELGGKLVLIGSDLDAVTLLHYAEAIAPISPKKIVRIKVPLLISGERQWVDVEEYNSSTGICDWPDRFFALIVEKYLQQFNCARGQVGEAMTYVPDARQLVDFAVPLMVQAAEQIQLEPSTCGT